MLRRNALPTFVCVSLFATTLGLSGDDRSRTAQSRTSAPRVERAADLGTGQVTAARIVRDRFIELIQIARSIDDEGSLRIVMSGLSDNPDPVSARDGDAEDPSDNGSGSTGSDEEEDGHAMVIRSKNSG